MTVVVASLSCKAVAVLGNHTVLIEWAGEQGRSFCHKAHGSLSGAQSQLWIAL